MLGLHGLGKTEVQECNDIDSLQFDLEAKKKGVKIKTTCSWTHVKLQGNRATISNGKTDCLYKVKYIKS